MSFDSGLDDDEKAYNSGLNDFFAIADPTEVPACTVCAVLPAVNTSVFFQCKSLILEI